MYDSGVKKRVIRRGRYGHFMPIFRINSLQPIRQLFLFRTGRRSRKKIFSKWHVFLLTKASAISILTFALRKKELGAKGRVRSANFPETGNYFEKK